MHIIYENFCSHEKRFSVKASTDILCTSDALLHLALLQFVSHVPANFCSHEKSFSVEASTMFYVLRCCSLYSAFARNPPQPSLDPQFPATLVLEENTFSVEASTDALCTPDALRHLVLLQGLRQQPSLPLHSLPQRHRRQYMHRSRFQHHRQY